MGQIIGRMMFGLMFCGLMGTVVLYTIDAQVRTSNTTPVIIVLTGLFTVLFGFASLMEMPTGQQAAPGATQEDLHRAYQAGYDLVDRQNYRQLASQERAYGAQLATQERQNYRQLASQERAYQSQLASQERQHSTTVSAFVTLSLADKQLINRGLEAGMRLVQVNRRLAIQYSNGKTQDVAEFEDLTPAKVKYMASAQERLLLPSGAGAGIAEGQYREI